MAEPPRIHIPSDERPDLERAVREGGGEPAPLESADGLVWLGGKPDALPELPDSVRWVQLPSAGVEQWLRAGKVDGRRAWTSATGAFGLPVAEHALALMLAGDKALHSFARERTWIADGRHHVRSLEGETVLIVGAGGIGRALIRLLEPFGAEVIAVTRRGRDVPGAARNLPADRLGEAWGEARHVVIAAPSTDGTRHLVGAAELAAMREDAWLVNVARGSLVDTEALVDALRSGSIAGAALDVTDPEPLPADSPLWEMGNVIISPHVSGPSRHYEQRAGQLFAENLRRYLAGAPLLNLVDRAKGY
jgi:phosphoglycerate dehydrogenase-like enzyme